jgi:uncharacterized protein HemX
MAQRINGRVAATRRGSSAFKAILALLVLVGAGIGGVYWWSQQPAKNEPGKVTTAADMIKSTLGDLEMHLTNIAKEPANADDEIANVKKITDEDLAGMSKQVSEAPANVKLQIVTMIKEYLPKIQTLLDAAYKVPGVKEKLEPIVTKLMATLSTLGAA